ncbi:MAG TPA: tRNA guanosine(34) transglycosylase Tgt [Edaphocola sp.]|nr:tRNA guanosine(34) transglycosylase Tgt [Edaphocola sp.]
MKFELIAQDAATGARAGIIHTDHGDIETPIFMPVGTAGSVKAISQQQLEQDIRAQIILGNTYHLYLRPGLDILEQSGGLHRFNHWSKPILTDSGGFQVFSLSGNRKLKEEGAIFQSHIDGSRHLFTPESVIDIQRSIGADIIMAFDECTPYPCDFEYARKSMERTHRWLERCVTQFGATQPKYGYHQSLFPIVQGSTFPELRRISAEFIATQNAEGNAIGGVSVGEPEALMYEITEQVCAILPEQKPRYLMGVGTPWNILAGIGMGIDMFDCVMPTRNGRNGMLFTTGGVVNIKNKKWATDFRPIDEGLGDHPVNYYTRAYLRHLFVAKEILALQLASLQNLSFYLHLVKEARQHIIDGDFSGWQRNMIEKVKSRN